MVTEFTHNVIPILSSHIPESNKYLSTFAWSSVGTQGFQLKLSLCCETKLLSSTCLPFPSCGVINHT